MRSARITAHTLVGMYAVLLNLTNNLRNPTKPMLYVIFQSGSQYPLVLLETTLISEKMKTISPSIPSTNYPRYWARKYLFFEVK